MSLKDSRTAANYMDFDSTLNKSVKLMKEDSKKYKIAFLTICGIHFGLRISDLLSLKHKHMLADTIQLTEQKTGKCRNIKVNETVKTAYSNYLKRLDKMNEEDYLFMSQKNNPFSIHQVNNLLQETYGTKNKNISSHSLRKTFGRRVWERDECSERALVMLSKIFNHTSTSTTRIYLGIQQEEMDEIYMNL